MNIVVESCESAPSLLFASQELERYLHRVFPRICFTQNTDAKILLKVEPQAGNDHYVIDLSPEGGSIIGSNARSVLLGVYRCLWFYGCRFLAPGAQHEHIPQRDESQLPRIFSNETASLYHRGVCIEGANSVQNILDFVDWLPKVGYNSFFLQFHLPYTFMRRWYGHELNALLPAEPFTREDAERETERIQKEIFRRGLLLHKVGHGWTGRILGFSQGDWKAADTALSPEKQELCAEIAGRRELWHGVPMNTNLCYSNPKAVEEFSNQVLDYCKEHPTMDYVHVWLADTFNNICECKACQNQLPTDQYIHLLNVIDQKLTANGLNTRIVFLLYLELLWPPKEERLANPDRFVLMFAPISRTFQESYSLEGIPDEVPEYHRNKVTLPTSLRENLAFLKGWQKVFNGQGFVYDYPLGRAHYGDPGYYHIASIISQDLKKINEMGLDGYISCQELRENMPNSLPNYVMGRTLFDTSLDFEDLCAEYFEATYGPDWQKAQGYLRALSSHAVCDYFNGNGPRKNEWAADQMQKLQDLMQNHYPETDRAILPEVQQRFWQYLHYHRSYGLLLAQALEQLTLGHEQNAQQIWLRFQQYVSKHEPLYQPCLDVYRITEVTANYTGFTLTPELKSTL